MSASPKREARAQLTILAICLVLGMAPWFSATVVGPAMEKEWHLAPSVAPWLTMAVQLGFVGGTLVSSIFMLSDRWSAQRLAGWSALLAALTTALIALVARSAWSAIALRALTGAALAGVYPPGMKLVAGWWKERRGMAIGVLVGALTIGSASPHLVRAIIPIGTWRLTMLAAAGSALAAGALLFGAVREGPYQAPSAPVSLAALRSVVQDRGVVLATAGYLGHMWELYAMWSWIAAFWGAVATRRALPTELAGIMAFATVAVGAVGCVLAGILADRYGRTLTTIVAMAVSGSCALIIGPLLDHSLLVLGAVTLVWGMSIVADSAQFSTCITELAPREYVGTALTVQTCLGFLLTVASIRAVPLWVERWGWSMAFTPLAIGPALGILAMWQLRQSAVATRLAGGAG
ncbi:MAG: MFS transporter [Gemmatimonadaceae bacterium]|nr:MFS transporter [Gemmatimonadaceae bacterium]